MSERDFRIPWVRRVWWHLLAAFCRIWFVTCYGYRYAGDRKIPRDRPVLVVSNHQSFFDPIIIGLLLGRPFWAMARTTLFDPPGFGWLIRSLNALGVRRGVGDRSALRDAGKILKAGETLLVFPEGTRSRDGTTGTFARGVALMWRQADCVVVPVGIAGAFDVWPRSRAWPRLTGTIAAQAGEPIPVSELTDSEGDEERPPHERLQRRVEALRLQARRRLDGDDHGH
ncbi:MAG: lysophospholipid acyltransferase family protein [Phycisphaeraceae bacterium]|nr:lysophospholipid acyltransferase family protein [Phycisphaeraceae bacterium]